MIDQYLHVRRFFYLFIGIILLLSGCTGLETQREEPVGTETAVPVERTSEKTGIYHKVGRKETLWRIAKVYGVSLSDIITANNIPDATMVEEHQLVFIPGASFVREIVFETGKDENEFAWPVEGKVVGYFRQNRGFKISQGIDIEVEEGGIVKASRKGRVVFADYLSGYGQTVILDHLDGFYTIYAQNRELLVQLGQVVLKHNEISRVGKNSQASYLHFQIRKNSIADNPLYYLP